MLSCTTPLKIHLSVPRYFQDISVHGGRKGISIALKRFFLKTKKEYTRRQNMNFSIVHLSSQNSVTSPTFGPATTIKREIYNMTTYYKRKTKRKRPFSGKEKGGLTGSRSHKIALKKIMENSGAQCFLHRPPFAALFRTYHDNVNKHTQQQWVSYKSTRCTLFNKLKCLYTLVYLKALATVQGSGYSFKKTWLQSKMADLPESYTTNAHFTEVTLSMPIWYT